MNMNSAIEQFNCIELHPSDFNRYVPPIPLEVPVLSERLRLFNQTCESILTELHEKHYHAEHLVGIHSRMLDAMIIHLFTECETEVMEKTHYHGPRATLVAVGGYGREEMNVHSDIDLLFLFPQKKGPYIEMLTEKVLYTLWDLKLEIGASTRTLGDCERLFHEDVTIMTSLLDARFLAGSQNNFEKLEELITRLLSNSAIRKKMAKKKVEEREKRIQKFGSSVFVLEPNVKESEGSLRDLQTLLWISKILGKGKSFEQLSQAGIISEDDTQTLIMARNFLWRIRNELHLITKKKVDSLSFHRQENVATSMGFKPDANGILAVEKFMQCYYNLAYQVADITNRALRTLTLERESFTSFFKRFNLKKIDDHFRLVEGQLSVKNAEVFKENPLLMMSIFKQVQDLGAPLHPDTKDYIRKLIPLINDDFRANPEAITLFRGMLGQYQRLGMVLMAMHETHFLDEWMPEFKKLRCRVQHDSYHIYTIDTHSIFAVNELSKLIEGQYDEKFPVFKKALLEVARPELLTLGLFLHDIGKGEGGNHSVKGAEIAKSVTQRLQFTQEEKEAVEFLIISHLMMPHLSQRRDLEDQELIIQFAKSMKTNDQLNMLFLLTWADIRAVGPEAWTDWKGTLLERLYNKTQEVITKGEFSKEKTLERVSRVKEAFLERFGDKYSREEFSSFLSLMPPRYFFAVGEKDIENHFLLYKKGNSQKVSTLIRPLPEQNLSEILVYTLNAPRVFSLLTGVMLSKDVNIIHVEVFQTNHGFMLLSFLVTDVTGKILSSEKMIESIKIDIESVLLGRVKVEELIAKRQVPEYLQKKTLQRAPSKISVDNDVSAYHTVIEIYTYDRLGLLYDITRTLNQLGCYVEVSKISTKVEQVADVFYVKDIFGHKIMAKERMNSIKKALQNVVDPPSNP